MGRALEYFRRVGQETDSELVRAVAQEREFVCEAIRISFTPYAPSGKGLAPTAIRRMGLADARGILRSLSRIVKDAARVEAPFLRAGHVRYGYSTKYNLPASKAVVGPVAPKTSPPASARQQRASKPDGMVLVQTKAASPPRPHGSIVLVYRRPRGRVLSPMAVVVARALVLVGGSRPISIALLTKRRVTSG